MKKISVLFSTIFMLALVSFNQSAYAAADNNASLAEMVEEMQDECPMEMAEGIDLTRVELQSTAVVMYFRTDSELIPLDPSMYSILKPILKSSMDETYKETTKEEEEFALFVSLMIKENKSFKLVFINDDDSNISNPLVIDFTTKELKAWL
ncbi:MAG: hypothetical protein J1F20_03670 [Muribaculaceae bacterium]|nr:hypothetical protein [Muribaculaceae bacterium]